MTSHAIRSDLFGQHHRLRHVAVQVLILWLFALAAGIVNACVLEPESRHGVASAAHDRHAGGAVDPLADAQAPGGHEHAPQHAGKAPCAKFCDEASAFTPTVKLQIDPLDAAGLALAPVASPPVEAPRREAGTPAAVHEPWRPAIPIPIAFLRLTL